MTPNAPPPKTDVLYLSPADERANTATHALGFLLSLLAGFIFWHATSTHELGMRICCGVFCLSMAVVYLFSTLSHAVHQPSLRNRLRAWDQGTIYGLIAGTYSPFIWQCSPSGFRWAIMSAVWIAAGLGFYSKVLSTYRINAISTVTYVLLGWLPAIPLLDQTPWASCVWMIGGGLFYTAGIALLVRGKQIRYAHAAWHCMVMLGSASHCWAIYLLLQESP